jgi:hypothetical protein
MSASMNCTLEVRDRPTELPAVLDVVDRGGQRAGRDTHCLRTDGGAGVVERPHRRLETAARLPDDPVRGDGAVAEVDLTGRRALDAQLAFLRAHLEARVIGVHHERGHPVGALVRLGGREHRVPARHSGVGDPRLGTVEHPVIAVQPGPGLHRHRVGAGLPLGQRIGNHRLAAGNRRHDLLLQLVRAGDQHRHAAQLVDPGDQRGADADPGDLFDHDAAGHRVGAVTAVLLGQVHRVEAGGGERLARLDGIPRVLIHVRGVRRDLFLGQCADRRAQLPVLLGQLEQVEVRVHEQ